MSPIRKTDDFRSVEIGSWDEYIQDEIAEMDARGEFENLPDRGKPIKIWQTDVNPEHDLAFSRLKNAGVKPLWMELDQEIGSITEALWVRLDEVEARIRDLIGQLSFTLAQEPDVDLSLWQRLTAWFRQDYSDNAPPPPSITEIMAIRERERARFLEMAMDLDKKISSYNNSLPKGGENLQRLRWLPERAARVFEERIALTDLWEEVRGEST